MREEDLRLSLEAVLKEYNLPTTRINELSSGILKHHALIGSLEMGELARLVASDMANKTVGRPEDSKQTVRSTACECGSANIGHPVHADWCEMGIELKSVVIWETKKLRIDRGQLVPHRCREAHPDPDILVSMQLGSTGIRSGYVGEKCAACGAVITDPKNPSSAP